MKRKAKPKAPKSNDEYKLTKDELRDAYGFYNTKQRLLASATDVGHDLATRLSIDQLNLMRFMREGLEKAIEALDCDLRHTGWQWDAEAELWAYRQPA